MLGSNSCACTAGTAVQVIGNTAANTLARLFFRFNNTVVATAGQPSDSPVNTGHGDHTGGTHILTFDFA